MSFAYAFPWWAAPVVVAAALAAGWLTYRRPPVPLGRVPRGVLVALRASTLVIIALLLFRPSGLREPDGTRDATVAILVDASRSMGIADAPGGGTRLEAARALVADTLEPALAPRYDVDVFTFGRALSLGFPPGRVPDGETTDLAGAIDALRAHYRGRPMTAAILVSDGGDARLDGPIGGPPVFAIGMGAADGLRDREVTGVAVGDQRFDQASVDVRASVISRGFERDPFRVQLVVGDQVVETREVTAAADGAPVDVVFTVAPDSTSPSIYRVEIPPANGELVAANNHREVLVAPAGRRRRLLALEGAPGFEHSFLARAWARDPSLEVDAIIRTGRNDEGQNTFFVQAAADRSAALAGGFPATRADLYAYDAVVLANIEADAFTRAQLVMLAVFVADRGGGLLVAGGQSFGGGGYAGTPLEPVLPVRLNDRQGALALSGLPSRGEIGRMLLTPEGERHPILRLGAGIGETADRWGEMPRLAAAAPLGAPRPGASLLAVTPAEGGGVRPLVAVQPYGQGRAMIFAGEASWRWRMLLPSTDGRYERFWRQTARWLAAASPDPVSADVPVSAEMGRAVTIDAVARTRAFQPAADATWTATVTGPSNDTRPLVLRRVDTGTAQFRATIRPEAPGIYHVRLDAHRGDVTLGSVDRWFLVGGVDPEFTDPRLNDALLARLARGAGGRYAAAAEAASLLDEIASAAPPPAPLERYDAWQTWRVFLTVAGLLAAEWSLRRRWGLT